MGHDTGRLKATIFALAAALSAVFAPTALAQDNAAPADITADAATTAQATGAEAPAAAGYVPMAPTRGKGMPTDPRSDEPNAFLKSMTFQDQYTEDGAYALGMHDYILMPIITVISIFVLFLLLYVVVRFSRRANPVPSRTTHNTAIEVIWTIVPVLILVVIAVPSITLLAAQYETPPEDAVTIKATGNQWYWTYTYPDHGDFEVISNMKNKADALADGEPYQMAVDNRMVVPVGVPLRVQTTSARVIHAFAVPSLWFKMDAVPGRLNEKLLTIEEPGVYYGQCSELCGARHAYMPIAVEALPMEQFEAWVMEQGGELPGADTEAAETAEPAEVALAE